MQKIGDISSYSPLELVLSGVASLMDPWVLLGVFLLLVFFAAHTLLLSWADLSYVLLIPSLGYVLVAVLSRVVLQQATTPARWAGTVLVTFGVGIVGATPVSTVRRQR